MFGTGLNYVVLRLLGVDAEVPMMVRARATLHRLGGCTGIPSWGKFWLSVLNVHSWQGVNPTPAELWLLPEWFPAHPWRWWIHTRNVYIPMGFISGKGFQAELDPLILSLRQVSAKGRRSCRSILRTCGMQELYVEPYDKINWRSCCNNVSSYDLYAPHSKVANGLFALLHVYEGYAPKFLKDAGLAKAYRLVCMEDENTSYQTIGPVSKAMNMMCAVLSSCPKALLTYSSDVDGSRRDPTARLSSFTWPRFAISCGIRRKA